MPLTCSVLQPNAHTEPTRAVAQFSFHPGIRRDHHTITISASGFPSALLWQPKRGSESMFTVDNSVQWWSHQQLCNTVSMSPMTTTSTIITAHTTTISKEHTHEHQSPEWWNGRRCFRSFCSKQIEKHLGCRQFNPAYALLFHISAPQCELAIVPECGLSRTEICICTVLLIVERLPHAYRSQYKRDCRNRCAKRTIDFYVVQASLKMSQRPLEHFTECTHILKDLTRLCSQRSPQRISKPHLPSFERTQKQLRRSPQMRCMVHHM